MKKISLMLLAVLFMIPAAAQAQTSGADNQVLSDKAKKKISDTITQKMSAVETLKIINEASAIPQADAFLKAHVFPFAKYLKKSKKEDPAAVLQAALKDLYEPLAENFAANKQAALNGAAIEPADQKAFDAVVKVLQLPFQVGWSKKDIALGSYLKQHAGDEDRALAAFATLLGAAE
ncbi:hypothetical protein [Candidatus Avelusimicrobium alvi]|uniref:hypothetical protein n=1 Tax=Candidatus Avelusimicrobium alvi TaxID=3416221 RepID=UPI003D140661